MAHCCCDICDAKNGESVKDVGYPPEHPNCRCTTISEVLSPEQFADKWMDFMNGGKQPGLAKWYNEIYLGKAA
jgi:hypothetical protein